MASSNRTVQTSTLIAGIVVGFLLYAIFRHVFYILVGIVIGAVLVMYVRRR